MKLNKIYTKTGDCGKTSLSGAVRVDKDDMHIEVCGSLDELNAVLGCLLAQDVPPDERKVLVQAQNLLFELGALVVSDFAMQQNLATFAAATLELESSMDIMQNQVEMPGGFILPGGTWPAALSHLARTVCRRAERQLCRLSKEQVVPGEAMAYINRLSDYLFMLSLKINFISGQQENLWQKRC